MFIPFGLFRNPEVIKANIAAFRAKYPTFRTVEEVNQIDYTKQSVKIILITEVKFLTSNFEYQYQFSNTSGRVYKTFYYAKKISRL